MEPTFLPISLSPFPTAFVPFLMAFIVASDTAPMTKPAARTTACSVQPYFLKILFTFSRSDSFSSSCSLSCTSLSFLSVFSVILSRRRSRTEGCSFSSSATLVSSYKSFSSSSISLSVISISSVLFGPRVSRMVFGNFGLSVSSSAK